MIGFKKSIYIIQFVRLTLGKKGSHACLGHDIFVEMFMCYVALIEDIVNPLLAKILQSIQKPTLQMSDQNSRVPSFSHKIHTINPKYRSIISGKSNHRYGQRQERPDGAH